MSEEGTEPNPDTYVDEDGNPVADTTQYCARLEQELKLLRDDNKRLKAINDLSNQARHSLDTRINDAMIKLSVAVNIINDIVKDFEE